jgi:endonuclease/exonuclease/phosphatase family metal-dependent hydrolase
VKSDGAPRSGRETASPDEVAGKPVQSRLSIATYNVRRCIGTDGVCDVNRIARVLSEIDADVVALQELSFRKKPRGIDQLSRLAEMSGYEHEACPVHENGDGAIGMGLLFRKRPLTSEKVDLSFERYEPRAALSVCISFSGVRVRIVSTHLGLRWRERRYQAGLLADELTRHPDEEVRILLGDLNDWIPGSPNLAALKGPVESDFWGSATFPSWFPMISLDEIWVSPGDLLVDRRAFRSSLSRRASDHLPLVATLELGGDRSSSPRRDGGSPAP